MTDVAHSKIGASSMKRWRNCPGSVALCEGIPNVSSEYAKEGTRAHALAEELLKRPLAPEYLAKEYDEEMMENVNIYVAHIKSLGSVTGAVQLIEHRFNLDNLYKGLFGTADAVTYHPKEKLLIVSDLKYGAGVPVDVRGNDQLLYYALGAMLSTDFKPARVRIEIIQPRCFHPEGPIRSWEVDAVDLIDFAADLVEAAAATADPKAPLKTGEWCRWCPAAATCPAIKTQAQEMAKRAFTATKSYDPEELADALEFTYIVEPWVKAVREFAYSEAEHGRTPLGYKLVEKRATRKWVSEEEAAKFLRKAGLEPFEIFETSILSPAKIEKVLGKDNKDLLSNLTVSQSSGYALVHESDKRQAVKKDAKSEFSAAGQVPSTAGGMA